LSEARPAKTLQDLRRNEELTMGIRRSTGKNKKSNRPTDAATVERDGILRQALKDRGRPGAVGNGMRKRPGK
jgi:hypothetical protein